jgi:hypothetical protein
MEQDNVLKHRLQIEDFEASFNEKEILQSEKVLKTLKRQPAAKSQEGRKEFS